MIFHSSRGHKVPVQEVVLHTAATPGDWWKGKDIEDVIATFDQWHRARGFRKIGYHRVFMPDGTMGKGRSLYETGAHVKGKNAGTIGLCMVPIKTHKGIKTFETYFTEAQRKAVKGYIKELNELTDIKRVTGHNQFSPKECPGFHVKTSDWV